MCILCPGAMTCYYHGNLFQATLILTPPEVAKHRDSEGQNAKVSCAADDFNAFLQTDTQTDAAGSWTLVQRLWQSFRVWWQGKRASSIRVRDVPWLVQLITEVTVSAKPSQTFRDTWDVWGKENQNDNCLCSSVCVMWPDRRRPCSWTLCDRGAKIRIHTMRRWLNQTLWC